MKMAPHLHTTPFQSLVNVLLCQVPTASMAHELYSYLQWNKGFQVEAGGGNETYSEVGGEEGWRAGKGGWREERSRKSMSGWEE